MSKHSMYAKFEEPEYDDNYPYTEGPESSFTRSYHTKGHIQAISRDKKSICIWGTWYKVSSRSEFEFDFEEIQKGDVISLHAVRASGNPVKWIRTMERMEE